MEPEQKTPGASSGIPRDTVVDFVKTFNTPHGRRVLDRLESRSYSLIRIDQFPTPIQPNPAFINPNAALYRAGMIDVINYCRRVLKKAKTHNLTHTSIATIEEEKGKT